MLKQTELKELDNYFLELKRRGTKGVFFYCINSYNRDIHEFILRYYNIARVSGIIIEGKLQNPDINNISYYNEIMGNDFQISMGFLSFSLKRWLPRMNDYQVENVAGAIYDTLNELKKNGKNDNILKNIYIKFMCWLYYKFERIVNHLGEENLPKILCEGEMSEHELLFLNVLSVSGCDIVWLQYRSDVMHLVIEGGSSVPKKLEISGMRAFPETFCLEQIRKEVQEKLCKEHLYGIRPQFVNCTNTWTTGKIFETLRKDVMSRGKEPSFFYNLFWRIVGVEDKTLYQNELYQLQMELKNNQRRIVIVNNTIEPPSINEINEIHRSSYQNLQQMIMGLSANIICSDVELQRIMHKAFVEVLLEEGEKTDKLNRITNRAVYLLCWLKRYQHLLFFNWKMPEVACFFLMGGCKSENEALFCRFLAKLPVDVIIFVPDLSQQCCLKDKALYETRYKESLLISEYPEDVFNARVGTVAYHAENELDELMFQDTGIYRNQQYANANAIILQTMFEEIPILWKEELKYRPNFSVIHNIVNIPVIFSKISGVKEENVTSYWTFIKQLITPETIVIRNISHLTSIVPNPVKSYATDFYKNGRLRREKIKQHKVYSYNMLRESMQDYLLDKLEALIEQKVIKGTGENGTEFTIIATVLNLDIHVLRLIQSFDFTKKNPKLIYIITGESTLSLEDAICVAFLNMIGFDILFFVPTGYQIVEKFFDKKVIEEHQIGKYMYDLQVSDLDRVTLNNRYSWRDFIFRKGI